MSLQRVATTSTLKYQLLRRLKASNVSLLFNGLASPNGNCVQVNNPYNSITDHITVSVKAKILTTEAAYGALSSGWNGATWNRYYIGFSTNDFILWWPFIGGSGVSTQRSIAGKFGTGWHTFTVTYDGTQVIIYYDGVQVGTPNPNTGNITSGTTPQYIGWGQMNTHLGGNIREVAVWNTALSPTDVSNIHNNGAKNVPTGLVSLHMLDEDSGSIAYDTIGGKNGTFVNSPVWTEDHKTVKYKLLRRIRMGAASLKFNGLSTANGGNYLQSTNPILGFTDQFTILAWVKCTNIEAGGYGCVISSLNGDGGDSNRLLLNGSTGIMVAVATPGHQYQGQNAIGSNYMNAWHHFAGIYDGVQTIAYLDGQQFGASYTIPYGGNITAGTKKSSIAWGGSSIYHLGGNIRELRVYNVALTPQEINDVYTNTNPRSSNLVAYYKMDEAAGSIAHDSVAGNDATFFNSPVWDFDHKTLKYALKKRIASLRIIKYKIFARVRSAVTSLQFNGLSIANGGNYVQIDNPYKGFTNKISIVAWVKFVSQEGGYGGIIDGLNGYQGGNRLLINNNYVLFQINATINNSSPYITTLAAWHHIGVTYDGVNSQLYLDGNAWGSPRPTTASLNTSTGKTIIGWGSPTIYHLGGNIRDLAIYNIDLTAQEIANTKNLGSNAVTRNCVSRYVLNENLGSIAVDSMGGRNGTLINSPQWKTEHDTLKYALKARLRNIKTIKYSLLARLKSIPRTIMYDLESYYKRQKPFGTQELAFEKLGRQFPHKTHEPSIDEMLDDLTKRMLGRFKSELTRYRRR